MFDLEGEKKPRAHLEGNMMPVINMTFLLLLFFIVAGNFADNISKDIYPPHSVSEALNEPSAAEFQLTRDGELLWDGQPTTIPAWADSFRADGLPVPRRVRLRADGATPAALILPVLDDLKFLQVSRVALVTVNDGAD